MATTAFEDECRFCFKVYTDVEQDIGDFAFEVKLLDLAVPWRCYPARRSSAAGFGAAFVDMLQMVNVFRCSREGHERKLEQSVQHVNRTCARRVEGFVSTERYEIFLAESVLLRTAKLLYGYHHGNG